MFFSPSFEPHSPLEPQWFPRPITDDHESQLDQLERLEEDRKRRLRSIASVAAKTPIGLGESNSDTAAADSANVVSNCHNSYSHHRYYPPPTQESMETFASDTVAESPSAPSTRRRHIRGIRTRAFAASEATPDVALAGDHNHLSHLPHSHISHDRSSIDSIQAASFTMSSPPLFNSPPLDPRGGGGRRTNNISWYTHNLQRQMQETPTTRETVTPRNFAFTATPQHAIDQDMITPEDQRPTTTPGHGHSEDVYSIRRRRRRMEMNS